MADTQTETGTPEKVSFIKKHLGRILWMALILILLAILVAKGFVFRRVVQESFADGIRQETEISVVSPLKCIVLVFGAVFSFFFYDFKPKISEKTGKTLAWILTVLSPIILYLLLEINFDAHFLEFTPLTHLGNLMILYSFCFFFFAVTNRFRLTVIIPAAFWLFFSIMNMFIQKVRGTAIVMSDLILWKSALQVAGAVSFYISARSCMILIVVMNYFLALFKIPDMKFVKGWKIRPLLMVLSILAMLAVKNDVYTRNYFNLKKTQYLPQRCYKKFGTALTFLRSGKILSVEVPEGYSPEEVAKIEKEYTSDPVEGFDVEKAPTVIVIMNEAFSDFERTFGLENSQEAMPFYHSLKENAIDGFLTVSIFGGQTANSEYEFLTGNSKAFIVGGVSPFQSYMKQAEPHISLVHSLKSLGYDEAVAFHPYNTKGYNRVQAYENLGFDSFLSQESVENPSYLREFISDQCDFDEVIRLYDEHKQNSDKPMMIFNVTMQNHLPYEEYFDNMEYPLSVKTEQFKDDIGINIYENLIRETDIAYENLIGHFSKEEDPVIIVMYGDHQPNIAPQADGSDPLQRYKVPFKIWANYDIEEKQVALSSPNLMGVELMKLIGAPLTGYQKFLLDFEKQVRSISYYGYTDTEGNFYDIDDDESPYYPLLEKYEYLQYNTLFDKEHMNNDFFYLGGKPQMAPGYYVK
ncbi:MAG: LTA synthase family protein [Lachnospiraceae bacterium]|nr:LTA synthase family protein [Lachnospiraceae bacterium]